MITQKPTGDRWIDAFYKTADTKSFCWNKDKFSPPSSRGTVSRITKVKRSDWKDHSVQVPSVTEREFRMFDDF